ncbi:MAG: alpha/beta fold hydrolase, partial [Cyanobacteria bacterium J06600_6]
MPSINILETPHIYELTAPVKNSKLPVLVFVHGWLLSRSYWQPLVALLESEYQCLIYDARGFGDSQSSSSSQATKSDAEGQSEKL